MARWENNSETRPMALIALAKEHDPASLDVFREALVHLDPAVRFAALEALSVWGHPDKALPLLDAASQRDADPLLRVYAAGGMARLGAPEGLARLRTFLQDASWLVRCMAARYLGEYGTADDYRLLVSKIGGETGNDFVVAEYCIAALKLFPKTAT
ncbi:MAG: HEAT repeat domain-containing protein, partial [Candidatus Methylomirabilota bacterium]